MGKGQSGSWTLGQGPAQDGRARLNPSLPHTSRGCSWAGVRKQASPVTNLSSGITQQEAVPTSSTSSKLGVGANSTKKSLQRVEPGHRILAALGLSTEPQHQTTCTASPWKWFLGLVLTQPQHLQNVLGLLPSDTLPGFTQGKPRKGKAEPPATAESR